MRKNEKGVITVFLALVFGLLITFLVNLVNMTMVNSAKNQMIIASDAAITSTLAGYNRDLFKDYGLLAFEEDEEMLNELVNILKENLSGNEGLNGMFNYDINEEDITAVTGGNPFEDNDVMKKQMIYAMKYQGTENLALEVFNKINQFLNSKEVIKESEKLDEINEKVEDIEDEIKDMQESKFLALEALVELAKNNNYEILGQGSIGYIESIDNITSYYPSNSSISDAFNSIKDYNSTVYLTKVYSYYYTKMILTMYKEYLSIKEPAEDGKLDLDKVDMSNIDKLISELDKLIDIEINSFRGKLTDYETELSKKKASVNTLINEHSTKVQPILDSYKESMETSQNPDIKKSAKESYDAYSELLGLENLNNVNSKLVDVLEKVQKAKSSLESIKTSFNTLITKDWVRNNKTNSIFNEMNSLIGKEFKYPSDVNNFVKSICENSTLKSSSELSKIKNIQIETISKNASGYDAIKMDKPTDNGNYMSFFKLFKSYKEKASEIKDIVNGKSTESFDPVIHEGNEENTRKLSEQLDEINNDYDLSAIESVINSAGGFADKVYLIEYIMTNFKDRSEEFANSDYKRIPEITGNDTTLNYEIEAVISGKYNDKESDTTLLDDFIAMRMALNTISLMTKQEKLIGFINEVSLAISGATGGVIPMPLVKAVITLGWAAIETKYDIIDIFNGYSVPVLKDSLEQWVSDFGLTEEDFRNDFNSAMNKMGKENFEQSKKGGNSYNNQDNPFALNYTDMTRFKLLITNQDKIIDRSQEIIAKNKDLQEGYKNYKSDIEVNIDKSKLNILFNTDVFSSKEGHKFNRFTFKKGYN